MKPSIKRSQASPDGLRYVHKEAGSPFGPSASYPGASMSCFKCGRHRIRSSMVMRQLAGRAQQICADECKK